MQKKALGKGLNALFNQPSMERDGRPGEGGRLLEIPVRDIIPGKYQPRKIFKREEINGLAASLKRRGVLQPVIVRRDSEGRYELIAGERRWRAATQAGLEKIPAVIRRATDEEAVELALIENLQREDLNPIETAKAYRRLVDHFHQTQEEVARRVGKDRSSVANALRILSLPGGVQEAILAGQISAGHAKALLSLSTPQGQLQLARLIVRKRLSVRETELAVARSTSPKGTVKRSIFPSPIVEAEGKIMRYLGTRVRILPEKHGGRLTIRYQNTADLNRLMDLILK